MGTAEEKPAGKLRLGVLFDRCMLLLFLAAIVWALVATFRFHAPFDGFHVSFLVLIVGMVCRPTRIFAIPAFLLLIARPLHRFYTDRKTRAIIQEAGVEDEPAPSAGKEDLADEAEDEEADGEET